MLMIPDSLSVQKALVSVQDQYCHQDHRLNEAEVLHHVHVPSFTSAAIPVSIISILLGPMFPIAINHVKRVLPRHLVNGIVGWMSACGAGGEMFKDYQTLLSQLEHAFNTSPSFSLQKLRFYVHPTVHTLSLIYQLILELAIAEDPPADLSPSEDEDEDEDEVEAARIEALGLGGAKLKTVLSEITKNDMGVANGASGISVKGGEVLTIIYERMQNMSGDPAATKVYGKLLTAA